MNWSSLLQHYGYWAILVGAFFEGETVMLLGAYAVHQHLMGFYPLVIVGALGGFIGDQFYYFIGRRAGSSWLQKHPTTEKKFNSASSFIDHHPYPTIMLMRFAWGLRTILPIAFGIKQFSWLQYTLINSIAAVLWSFIVVSFGFNISHFIHSLLESIHIHKHVFWVFIVTLSLTLILFRLIKSLIKKK